MLEPLTSTLFAGGALRFAAGVVYALVGYRLGRRQVSDEGRLPAEMFRVWWFGLAATTFLGAATTFLAAFGHTPLDVNVAITYLNVVFISVGLCGLLYYLLYLYTGMRDLLAPLVAFYAAFGALLLFLLASNQPIGVEVQAWEVDLVYQRQLGGLPLLMVLALLVFPQVGAAIAYMSLAFQVRSPTHRYRILLVSGSIMTWFGSSFVASVAGLADHPVWQLVSRLVGLGAAVAILYAYQPPRWVQRRYGIRPVGDDRPVDPPAAAAQAGGGAEP